MKKKHLKRNENGIKFLKKSSLAKSFKIFEQEEEGTSTKSCGSTKKVMRYKQHEEHKAGRK